MIRTGTYERWEAAGKPASGARPGEKEDVGQLLLGEHRVVLQRYSVIPPLGSFDGDLDAMALYAGESVERINDIAPAGELVERLLNELRRAVN